MSISLRSALPAVLLLCLAMPLRTARATPSFALMVDTGGVDVLQVGETLQFRALPPYVFWPEDGAAVKYVEAPLAWRVSDEELAGIDLAGRLTAIKPGTVTVFVECVGVPEGELPAGMPTSRSIEIRAVVPGGRLPVAPRAAGLLDFELGWTGRWGREGKWIPAKGLRVSLFTKPWRAWIGTAPVPDKPFPWELGAVAEESGFNDEGYADLLGQEMFDRWQKNLLSGSLVIESWEDGVARGQLRLRSRPGPALDTPFTALLDDPHGLLAAAERATRAAEAAREEEPGDEAEGGDDDG